MDQDKSEEVVQELLRVGLIAIRNLAFVSDRSAKLESMLREWSVVCHSLPPILLGKCDRKSLKYFLDGDAANFLRSYPGHGDADFEQMAGLLEELHVIVRSCN